MSKRIYKTTFTMLVICVVLSMVIIPTFAAITYLGTTVNWNAAETAASATGTGTSTNGDSYTLYVSIRSNSTGDLQMASVENCVGTRSITTGAVNVTYPSPIPLVTASGSVK